MLVILIPRHTEDALAVVFRLYSKPFQGVQGHVHIAPALQVGGEPDLAVPLQQGQGIQQAGDELGGHVARQGVNAGGQLAPYRQHPVLLFVEDALLPEEGEVGVLGPLHQPPVAGELAAPLEGQSHRNEKAEGGAALPAVHHLGGGLLVAVHQVGTPDDGAVGGSVGIQGAHTPQGGLDVLRQVHVG